MIIEDFTTFPWIIPVCISTLLFFSAGMLTWYYSSIRNKSDPPEHRTLIPSFFTQTTAVKDRKIWILPPILIIAALFRFPGINSDPLNHLEQMYFSTTFESGSILRIIAGDVPVQQSHQPVFSLLLLVFGFLQDSPESFRYISVFLSLLSIIVTYYLAALLFPRFLFARIFMSMALALSQLHIVYSKDITPYSLFFLLSTISFYLFFLVMKTGENKSVFLYICVSIITFYTHYYEIWILAIQVSIAFVFLVGTPAKTGQVDVAGKLLKSAAWIHLLMVPWYPCFIKGRITSEDTLYFERLIYQGNLSLHEALREILRIFSGLKEMGDPIWMIFFVILLFGLFISFRRDKYLFASIFLPILTGIMVDVLFFSKFSSVTVGGYHFGVRHYIFMLPFYHASLYAACSCLTHPAGSGLKPFAGIIVGGILLIPSFDSAILYGFKPFRPDIKNGAAFVADHLMDGDAVAVLPAGFQSDLFGYYFPAVSSPNFSTPAWHSYKNKTFFFPVRSVDIPLGLMVQHPQFKRIWLVKLEYDLFNVPIFSDKTEQLVIKSLPPGFKSVSISLFRKLSVELVERKTEHAEPDNSGFTLSEPFIDFSRPGVEHYFATKYGSKTQENRTDHFCSIFVRVTGQSRRKAAIRLKFPPLQDAPGRPEIVKIHSSGATPYSVFPLNPEGAILSVKVPCRRESGISSCRMTIRGRRQSEIHDPGNPMGLCWIRIIPDLK